MEDKNMYGITLDGTVYTVESSEPEALSLMKKLLSGKIAKITSVTNPNDVDYYPLSTLGKVKKLTPTNSSKKVTLEIL